MGTKKGRIYGKGAPFKGEPQKFGGEVVQNCRPPDPPLASAMPKSVMPSGAKNGRVSQEKKRKNLAVLTKTPRLKRFFFSKASKQQR